MYMHYTPKAFIHMRTEVQTRALLETKRVIQSPLRHRCFARPFPRGRYRDCVLLSPPTKARDHPPLRLPRPVSDTPSHGLGKHDLRKHFVSDTARNCSTDNLQTINAVSFQAKSEPLGVVGKESRRLVHRRVG